MDLATQSISNDQTVRSNTVQDLKKFNTQSLATQAKKLVSMMPANKKNFDLTGDDIVDLSTANETFKNQIGDYDKK